jgi:hypothetical protein
MGLIQGFGHIVITVRASEQLWKKERNKASRKRFLSGGFSSLLTSIR